MASRISAPGEFVESVRIPRPAPDMLIRIVKLSKRFDSDISAVCGAFALAHRRRDRARGADRLRRHGRHPRPRAGLRGGARRQALDRSDGRSRGARARRGLSRRSTICAAPPPIASPPPPICSAASGPSRPSPSACSMADRSPAAAPRRAGASTSRCRTTAPTCMSPARRAYVDDLPEPPGMLHLRLRPCRRRPCRLARARPRRGPRGARRGRGLHRRRHPRREQCRPGRA